MGKYIADAVKSIKETGYPEKEIIIVNDGSNEQESLISLDGYRKEEGIIVIDTKNFGLAKARNTGASAATGQYLAFLDADDMVEASYYEKAIAVLERYENIHFIGCWVQYFEGSDRVWPAFAPEPPEILYHNTINSSSLVYKRESFLSAGQNDAKMPFQGWEDYESVIAMNSKRFHGAVLPEPLFKYRVRPHSMVRNLTKTKKTLLCQYISEKHQLLYNHYSVDILNLTNANGPGSSIDNPTLDYHLADNLPLKGKVALKIIAIIKRNKYVKSIAYKLYHLIK